ncbi:MAG: bifunctional oligoribonuclease/PAP phosphatase NrnA [Eggerthellaceae bacterium]|nr:bifunctional oligoribonuclease/PAP phosphatase NrnA [Eggerthellaceae bacterium]
MAISAQTNTTLQAIAQVLSSRDGFVICGHVNPDGDCVGSQLALANALRALGKTATCVFAQDIPHESTLACLPGFDGIIPSSEYAGSVDTFIAVDVSDAKRMGDAAKLFESASFRIIIDHHEVDTCISELNYVEPDAASTSMIVWELIGYLEVEHDPDAAACAYVGLMTDTGRFQFQNTDARAFSAAAEMVKSGADPSSLSTAIYQNRTRASVSLEHIMLGNVIYDDEKKFVVSWVSRDDMESVGAKRSDAESLIDTLRSIRGIRVACMLRGEDGCVRGSLRAKDGTDVARIARMYGGGGHVAASGFTIHDTMDAARNSVLATLEKELS